jgi:hypothetical protein
MRKFFILILILFGQHAVAQFQIGHTSITFIDASRGDRAIATEIYYPASAVGEDVPVANGMFVQITFGHGFVMAYSAYQNIWEHLVPQGYVMAFVTTEGGIAPSHEDFGLDLSFVLEQLNAENEIATSLFYNHMDSAKGIMGHSMGGGASFLAAANLPEADFVIGLAPAETNPSAIEAAVNVSIPCLILSGSNDAVTPPAEHHIPIFEGLASECKSFVNVVNGSHCGFANAGSLCDFGEFGFVGITRQEQQAIMNDVIDLWLGAMVEGEGQENFQNYFYGNISSELSGGCWVNVQSEILNAISLFPNPAQNVVQIQTNAELAEIVVYDMFGKMVLSELTNSNTLTLNVSSFAKGIYLVQAIAQGGTYSVHILTVQ